MYPFAQPLEMPSVLVSGGIPTCNAAHRSRPAALFILAAAQLQAMAVSNSPSLDSDGCRSSNFLQFI